MGVQPGARFDSGQIPWGAVGFTALGVLVTVAAVVLAAYNGCSPAGKESLVDHAQRIKRVTAVLFNGVFVFASSVVASRVGSACPTP